MIYTCGCMKVLRGRILDFSAQPHLSPSCLAFLAHSSVQNVVIRRLMGTNIRDFVTLQFS
jgi:hypothetical protein